jgi:hypothetical protein
LAACALILHQLNQNKIQLALLAYLDPSYLL